MYISVRKHILSNAIMGVAIIKIIAALLEGGIRILLNNSSTTTPSILDSMLWRCQIISSLTQILLIIIIFYFSWKKLEHYMSIVPKEDQKKWRNSSKNFLEKDAHHYPSHQ